MQVAFILLLYAAQFVFCIPHKSIRNVTTITQPSIRRSRAPGSSARLSLINYRFNKRPKRKNMDTNELNKLLGDDFDPQFMSINKPAEFGATFVIKQDSWKFSEILNELQSRNLTLELQELAEDDLELPLEYIQVLEKWMMKKASCPVRYAWEDIGAMFWPRYIRRGECSTRRSSCSWPSGMHCVPSDTSSITILRWQCKPPKGKGRRRAYRGAIRRDYKEDEKPVYFKCQWVRVPYPIINECMCTC